MNEGKTGAFIIGMNGIWEQLAAAAARISTQKGDALNIFENSKDNPANRGLIKKVLSSGHYSVLEHIVINIAFQNVSAVVEQFMIEFRLASFMVKSRRYVDFSDAGYYVPKSLNGANEKIFRDHINYLFGEYEYMESIGVPKEDARFLLPYCFCSNFYCTVNARELLLIIRRMMYGKTAGACELKSIGGQLLHQLKESCPALYDEFYVSRSEFMADTGPAYIPTAEDGIAEGSGGIELIHYSEDADDVLRTAARVKGETYAGAESVLKKHRTRELEHLTYTFIFRGISLSGITHVARHRMQSLTVPSVGNVVPGRYLIPETIRRDEAARERYAAAFRANKNIRLQLKANSADEDDLCYLVLSGNLLDVMSTMNARELSLFFKLRSCRRAQWEIRDFADGLHKKLAGISPEIFMFMGPSCYVEGACPEGKLSCGRPRANLFNE